MPGRKSTFLVSALIFGAAGLAWWLRPYPPEVSATSGAADIARPPAPAAIDEVSARKPAASTAPPPTGAATGAAAAPAAKRNPAFERAQTEKTFKQLYEDVGAEVGTSKYETSQLIGMLVDHHMQGNEIPFEWNSIAALERVRELRSEQRADLLAFLGASRLAALDKYEASLGARREVAELTFVLGAASDTAMTEDQRRRFIRAAIDAHAYYAEPEYTGVESLEVLAQEKLAKMELLDMKMLDVARGILTSAQLATLQDWQQARRDTFEATNRPRRD